MTIRFLTFVALLGCAACGSSPEKTTEQATTTTTTVDSAATTQPADGTATAPPTDTAMAGGGASATGTRVKACDLVTADELMKITGLKFGPGQSTGDQPSASQCGWDQLGSSAGGVNITLYEDGASAINNAKTAADAVKTLKMERLTDLGDDAYARVIMGRRNAVLFRKGQRAAQVDFNYPTADPNHIEQVARLMAQKL